MLHGGRHVVHEHQLDAGLRDLAIGRRRRHAVDRDGDDAVGMALDGVLDVGDLLVHLVFGGGHAGQRHAILRQRIGHALDLQLRPVEVHRLHGDADLEMPRLDLRRVGFADLERVDRGRRLAIGSLADDACGTKAVDVDALHAGAGRLRQARVGERDQSARHQNRRDRRLGQRLHPHPILPTRLPTVARSLHNSKLIAA